MSSSNSDTLGNDTDTIFTFPSVEQLDNLSVQGDSAALEVPSEVITYSLASLEDFEFKDRVAFANVPFVVETKRLESMAELLKEARDMQAMLYAYRSCSKAIPWLKTKDVAKEVVEDAHKKTFNILVKQIQKIRDLMAFHEKAVAVIGDNVRQLVSSERKEEVISDDLLDLLIRCIDNLMVVDQLKDMRASLGNDFTRYKRSFAPIQSQLENASTAGAEIAVIQAFLNNPTCPKKYLMNTLKTEIHNVPYYDAVISLLLHHCVHSIENQRYITPAEKFTFHRVIPYLLFILDSTEQKGVNAFRHKKIPLKKLQKLMKLNPVMPLFMDQTSDGLAIFSKCKHWDVEKLQDSWRTRVPKKLVERYELMSMIDKIRNEYYLTTGMFIMLMNEIKYFQRSRKMVTPLMLRKVIDVVTQAMSQMSGWCAHVKEQFAWKYSRPCSTEEYKSRGGSDQAGKEYEMVVLFNHTPDEWAVLIDVIGMIKGLASLMLRNEGLVVPLIRRAVHDEFQIFLQGEVARPLRKAFKRKRHTTKDILMQMRDVGCDWVDRKNQVEDYKQKKKELLVIKANRDFPRRATSPSPTQIALLRRMINAIHNPRSTGMKGGLFTNKDLKDEWIPVWQDFYARSFYYKYLLNYAATIHEIADMSDLWFREYYLEMSKCVQFPIAMSIPWIMTDFIIHSNSMKENVVFPFDLYNDAGEKALSVMKEQYMYDEVEAELNLTFNQLMYHLSTDIFEYIKTVACKILIDKAYEKQYAQVLRSRGRSLDTMHRRYDALMSQRNVKLLGRSVDMQVLLSERINMFLREHLDKILARFEASDLSSVILTDLNLKHWKLVHALLSERLTMDPVDQTYREVNHNTTMGRFFGSRVVRHIFEELASDLLPNFVYNETTNRFVRGQVSYNNPIQREKINVPSNFYYFARRYEEVFERQAGIHVGYFGVEHVHAVLNILAYCDVPLIISELLRHCRLLVEDFCECGSIISKAIPPMKLQPGAILGMFGVYQFFEVSLDNNMPVYEDMRSMVFQLLREFGNTVVWLRMLDSAVRRRSDFAFQQEAFFQGILAKTDYDLTRSSKSASMFELPTRPDEKGVARTVPVDQMIPATPTYRALQYVLNVVAKKNPPVAAFCQSSLTSVHKALQAVQFQERAPSVFAYCVSELSKGIQEVFGPGFRQKMGDQGQLDFKNPRDFSRLWSSLLFLFCRRSRPSVSTTRVLTDFAIFGDGFVWAGCTFLHALGQREFFHLLDINRHLQRVRELYPMPEAPEIKQAMKKEKTKVAFLAKHKMTGNQVGQIPLMIEYFNSLARVQRTERNIFSCLNSYFAVDLPYTHEYTPSFTSKISSSEVKRSVPAPSSYAPPPPSDDVIAPPPPPSDDSIAPPPPPSANSSVAPPPPPSNDSIAPPPPPSANSSVAPPPPPVVSESVAPAPPPSTGFAPPAMDGGGFNPPPPPPPTLSGGGSGGAGNFDMPPPPPPM